MSQGNLFTATTGTVSGLQLSTNINNALAALCTMNSGTSAPANAPPAGTPLAGQLWLDTSVAPNKIKVYDGTSWLIIGALDTTNHLWLPIVGGGTTTLASSGTTDLGSVNQPSVTVSGTTTITSFGSSATVGILKFVTFSGALTLTHNGTSLILPTAANITTAAGDNLVAICTASGNWRVLVYQKTDGSSLLTSGTIGGSFAFTGIITPGAIGSDQNDFAPTGNATATVWRLSTSGGNRAITGISGGTTGRMLKLYNTNSTGGGNITIPAQSTSSTAANRLASLVDIVMRPGEGRELQYDGSLSRWVPTSHVSAAGGWGSRKGLTWTNNSGTPNSIIDVTADSLVLQDVDGNTVRLLSVSQSPSMATSGAGGIDSGAEASSSWYYIWIIYNPATGVTSSLFSSSATTPTMPSGYTFKIRVGAVYNDGSSNFMRIKQIGNRAQYTVVASTNTAQIPVIANGVAGTYSTTSPTLTTASVANFVPSTALEISITVQTVWKNTANGGILVAPSDWGGTNNGPRGSNGQIWPVSIEAGSAVGLTVSFMLESTSVYWVSAAAGDAIACLGWIDNV